jgi:hypothetical protein
MYTLFFTMLHARETIDDWILAKKRKWFIFRRCVERCSIEFTCLILRVLTRFESWYYDLFYFGRIHHKSTEEQWDPYHYETWVSAFTEIIAVNPVHSRMRWLRETIQQGCILGGVNPPLNLYLRNRLYLRYTFQIFLMWIIL